MRYVTVNLMIWEIKQELCFSSSLLVDGQQLRLNRCLLLEIKLKSQN